MAPHSPSTKGHCPDSLLSDTDTEIDAGGAAPIKKPSQALSIVELLEQVFLELPIRYIITCRRVCRQWKDVIDQTPSLQRALWMAPPTSGPLEKWRCRETQRASPAHLRIPFDLFETSSNFHKPFGHPVILLLSHNGWVKSTSNPLDSDIETAELYLYYLAHKSAELESWLKMFFTNPPTTCARLSVAQNAGLSVAQIARLSVVPDAGWVEIHNPGGITIGDVILAIKKQASWPGALENWLKVSLRLWVAPEHPDSY
ncbi:uncharacterized protein BDZ99DRAFT_577233 [Mytilinidion resinicola]|uniref:F-box domain-containing protein n=1 Tax=Mytilinidion resinicola TaxID=574789 RepID=A0A6A6XZM8_9PEZI|nr:uncharacterized protein BDZ99DRAFT_577233 [Mytilinidion resinicola]KAF2802021.1 hypothetical protein BDZ99DRAFT_577233 [Mytilinidion resinicola]